MEAAAGVAAVARAVSLTIPPIQTSGKEWRVVSEHSVRNAGNEDLELSKLGQSDERLIYEVQHRREPADVDFCAITINGSSDNGILQQRLLSVVKQRKELEHLEIELKARLMARSEILEIQNRFDSQLKDQVNANIKLQEQMHEKEKTIHELERKMEEKDKELHAIRLEHEAAWAKDDLLREQNKELATFRRERDNSEAERAQHIKQICDLQEHIQEKEQQLIDIQDQHRVAQETVLFKDEQLREAQAWITRVQEMDALQSTTNHSLQAELQERTEQYNQLWLGCHRQFAEMERIHLHTIQKLQLELSDAKERIGTYTGASRTSQTNSKESSQFGPNSGSELDASAGSTPGGKSVGLSNGNAENISPSSETAPVQMKHVPGLHAGPKSLLGVPAYVPPGQLIALQPFVMHHQGLPQSVSMPPHVSQSHVGQFYQSVPTISSLQHWQTSRALSEGSHIPDHNQYPSQNDQNSSRADTNYDDEVSMNGQAIRSDYLDIHISQGVESHSSVQPTNEVLESIDNSYMVHPQLQQSLQQISSRFRGSVRLDSEEHHNETLRKNVDTLSNHGVEMQISMTEQISSAAKTSEVSNRPVNFGETTNKVTSATDPQAFISSEIKGSVSVGKTAALNLLDEESLLACIVRTIPPGPSGKIRISSTLPNRLGKMLAPLHWHDYKKKYGKLEDFVGCHTELFVIEGDCIQLREGAQEIIAAMAARAKVRAAAATSSHPLLLSSVAVTPMAQPQRQKKFPSTDSNIEGKSEKNIYKESQQLVMPNHYSNGVSVHAGGIPTVKILSKPKDQTELNGFETSHGQASIVFAVSNGANPERSDLSCSQSKGIVHGRPSGNFSAKQHGRSTGTATSSRR